MSFEMSLLTVKKSGRECKEGVLILLQSIVDAAAGWEKFGAYAGMLFIFTMFLRYFGNKMDANTQAMTRMSEEFCKLSVALQSRPCMGGDK